MGCRLINSIAAHAAVIVATLVAGSSHAWVQRNNWMSARTTQIQSPIFRVPVSLHLANDSLSNLSNIPEDPSEDGSKLGINLDLIDLTEKEAAELKAAATEVINDAVAAGLDDLDQLRAKLKKEMLQRQKVAALESEFKTAEESSKLLSKIDRLTDDFLEKTAASRISLQQAATADQQQILEGGGVEVGSWGTLGGKAVRVTDASATSSSSSTTPPQLLVLADSTSDTLAKQLLEPIQSQLQTLLKQNDPVTVSIQKPTATIPLGGENAAVIVIFLTSWSDASNVKRALDRCWRQTLDNTPPDQVVAISTVGTERTQKLPYSMKNLLSGGQLDKRRQMEEAVITMAKQKGAIDYTICKVGEVSSSATTPFSMSYRDTLDGTITVDTAASVIAQAMIDPRARNTTVSVVGSEPTSDELEDGFLRLYGPEIWRTDEEVADYDAFGEYMLEWASALATSGRGLTTPVRVDIPKTLPTVRGVKKSCSVRLVFLPTATGKNYMSKDEERERESQRGSTDPSSSSTVVVPNMSKFNDGGLEFIAEMLQDGSTRARVRRCNYGNDVVVKELTEQTIMSRFRKSIDVWRKTNPL